MHQAALMRFTLRMDRDVLADAQRAKMDPCCPGQTGRSLAWRRDTRSVVEAVLWSARSGRPWRDLPDRFGDWSTAFRRFSDGRKADRSKRMLEALTDEPDRARDPLRHRSGHPWPTAMGDATPVKIHRHRTGR